MPFRDVGHAALTLEWSRLEPNVIDRRTTCGASAWYGRWLPRAPAETADLVSFTR